MEGIEKGQTPESLENAVNSFYEASKLSDLYGYLAWATPEEMDERIKRDKDFVTFLKEHQEADDTTSVEFDEAQMSAEVEVVKVAEKLISAAKKMVPNDLWHEYLRACGTKTMESHGSIMSGVPKNHREIAGSIRWDEFMANPESYIKKAIEEDAEM